VSLKQYEEQNVEAVNLKTEDISDFQWIELSKVGSLLLTPIANYCYEWSRRFHILKEQEEFGR
jgi:hypothetical protein